MSVSRSGTRARRMVALAMATLVVAAGAVLGIAAPASAAPADTIYSLVNQARWAQGLPGLIRNPAIDGLALNWANQMGASGSMVHNPSYSSQIPSGWTRAGENVASGHPSAEAMFNGWMASEGHRANILGDYTDIGIAFVTVNGTTWGVQDFGKYPGHVGPSAPAPAPAPVAPPPPAPTATPEPQPSPTAAQSTTPSAAPSPTASPSAQARAGTVPGLDAAATSGAWPAFAAVAAVVLIGIGFLVAVWRRRRLRPGR